MRVRGVLSENAIQRKRSAEGRNDFDAQVSGNQGGEIDLRGKRDGGVVRNRQLGSAGAPR
jgi:hypothetical protein